MKTPRSKQSNKKSRTTQKSRKARESRSTRKSCATTRPTRKPPAKQGRKDQKSGKAGSRKARAGRGKQSLVEAVNTAMTVEHSVEITQALIDRAKLGDVTCARFLREVAGESTPASRDIPDPQILALNLPRPQDLEAEPQWVEPVPGAVWVGDHWQNPPTEETPTSDH